MGLFNALAEWREASREKKIVRNRERGTCPACTGQGYYPLAVNEYMAFESADAYTCQQCSGSGLYADWERYQNQL